MQNFNTPYDDIFCTMMSDCKRLFIPLINEFFGKAYSFDMNITMTRSEHYMQKSGNQKERVLDFHLAIDGEPYRVEYQSNQDGSILIRVWENGSLFVPNNSQYDEETNELHVNLSRVAILYLRSNENTPDHSNIFIATPGGPCCFRTPNLEASDYGIDEIFEKKLYFLIPFHLFAYEERLKEYDENETLLSELKQEYSEIFKRLYFTDHQPNLFEKEKVRELSKKVLEVLANTCPNIREALRDAMDDEAEHSKMKVTEEGLNILFDIYERGFSPLYYVVRRSGLSKNEFLKKFEKWKKENNFTKNRN